MHVSTSDWYDNGNGVKTRMEDECKAVNMEAVMQPFAQVPVHIHEENEEIFLIMDGYLIENVTGRRVDKGQFLVVPENTHHGFDAPEGAKMRVILKERI